jgi:peptidoglycan/xylan/chitin deacetylase (PgdA/CDA1 family)
MSSSVPFTRQAKDLLRSGQAYVAAGDHPALAEQEPGGRVPGGRVPGGRVPGGQVSGGRAGRGAFAAAGVVAASLAVFQAGPGVCGLGSVRRRFFPLLSGIGLGDHVALTFDDGPDEVATPVVLDVLRERGVRATFFQLGSQVQAAPRMAAQVVAAGHEVGVHGWVHRYLPLRGPVATYDDLARAKDAIAAASGTVPRLFRPPYGVLSSAALLAARRLGLTPVLWSCWGREWTPGATSLSVLDTLLGDLDGGATVLLHDSDCTSPAGSWRAGLGALPSLLDECARRGLRVGPLSEHGPPWARSSDGVTLTTE